jgi:hypothetical protein
MWRYGWSSLWAISLQNYSKWFESENFEYDRRGLETSSWELQICSNREIEPILHRGNYFSCQNHDLFANILHYFCSAFLVPSKWAVGVVINQLRHHFSNYSGCWPCITRPNRFCVGQTATLRNEVSSWHLTASASRKDSEKTRNWWKKNVFFSVISF